MSFALLGVVAMQLYFLTESYNMQSKVFDRSVTEALDNVATKLGRQDADKFLSQRAEYREELQNKVKQADHIFETANNTATGDNKIIVNESVKTKKKPLTAREKQLAILRDSLKRMVMSQKMDEPLMGSLDLKLRVDQFMDEFGDVQVRYTPMLVNKPFNRHKLYKYDTIVFKRYIDPQFGEQIVYATQINPLWKADQERKEKERKVRRVKQWLAADSAQNAQGGKTTVMQNLYEEYQRSGEPLKQRLNAFWIDSLLRFELHNKGIYLLPSYEVTTANNDSLIFSNVNDVSGSRPQFIAGNTYQTAIFKDVLNDPGMIRLTFPQKNSLILSKMKVTMGTTAGLLFVLVLCFGYTLFSIIRQKKISEMKTDFINNMTHEFKTPVSTIMIASEALKDNEITSDKARVSRLANIIYEENERLGSHIERVLNVARIDKNDFKLESKPVDINEMISVVVDSMALKLQKCEADVSLHLDAETAIVNADELHLSNVLYNLIDNAIKYSEGVPQITISSFNKNGQVVIKVADRGIGMSRDQQTKIFEQFYRIPTGNVHNVKGFGLGLSYVNTIVKRLNGSINVRSERDKGSEFELKFPVA